MLNVTEKTVEPTVTPTKEVTKKDCCDKPGGCGNCMKGGMPMKKEVLSFITLLMVGITTVLGVLLINEKRSSVNEIMDPAVGTTMKAEQMLYEMPSMPSVREVVELPEPDLKGTVSLEETIQERRSRRIFSEEPVTMAELSQILWSAQGETDETGHRAAPSAKGAYPYSLYVVVRNVEGMDEGLYLYDSVTHSLGSLGLANAGAKLIEAGVQDNSQKAPVVIGMVASFAKMQEVFPDADPHKNTYLEGGHIGQNIYLQVEALGMATVVTGGFNPMAVAEALELDTKTQEVVYLVPFGHIGETTEVETH